MLTSSQTSKMSPTLKNICKANREQEGYTSFVDWFTNDKNIYIGRNAAKYTQKNVTESKWANPFVLCDGVGADKEWMMRETLNSYEKYVRNNPFLMFSLSELKDKNLGCWCAPSPCHGDVLIKLYKEKCDENSVTETQVVENPVTDKTAAEKPATEKKRKLN